MRGRGRPPSPGILTPREEKVLGLIRAGLSNREIGERLGISLQGVKYHVTEILSKLGVGSREEAAAWSRERQRRWAMLPVFSLMTGLRASFGAPLVPKLAAVLAASALLAAGLGAAWKVSARRHGDRGSAAGEAPVEARLQGEWRPCDLGVGGRCLEVKLSEMCRAILTSQCLREMARDFSSLPEARAAASFKVAAPAYVPAGFQPHTLKQTYPGAGLGDGRAHDGAHNDQVGLYYRDANGRWLALVQGFPGYLPLYEQAPDDRKGTVRIGERLAIWVKGVPPAWSGQDEGKLTLYWEVGRVGGGWERLPDGAVLSGSPMSYSITSDGLSLDELVRIAESQSFE